VTLGRGPAWSRMPTHPGRRADPPGPGPAVAGRRLTPGGAGGGTWAPPKTRGRRGWRRAARWARTPTGRSAAGSTGPCPPGCRWRWPRCGPRPTWCHWSRSRSAWPGRRCWRPARAWRAPAGSCQLGRRRHGWGGGPAPAPGRAAGALLDGVLDRVADAAVLAGLGLWALDGHDARGVLVLTVAATAGALLSMASKDRAAALGLPPAPERALAWLLGGRAGTDACCWWPWARCWAPLSRPWPRSRPPRRCRSGRLPAPPAGRLTAPAPQQLRISEQHHSVQYPRDDRGAEVVGQAFSSAPPRSNTDQSGHAFLWSAMVVVAGTR
jgi:hypothetical protein